MKGLEPPLPYGKQILSLPRLPFRHTRAVRQPARQIYMACPILPSPDACEAGRQASDQQGPKNDKKEKNKVRAIPAALMPIIPHSEATTDRTAVASASQSALPDRPPQAFRGCRHRHLADAERLQRID